MKRMWPFELVVLGILIILVGFVYDILFAGIPYQDPTAAMEAAYNKHAQIASIIRWAGASIIILGGVMMVLRKMGSKRR